MHHGEHERRADRMLTHFHADFVSGHIELQDRCGASIHLGARGQADYAFNPLRDADAVDLGSVKLTAIETPGHTPESLCYLIHDLEQSGSDPYAVLTGDTLFIGDAGRPDLMASYPMVGTRQGYSRTRPKHFHRRPIPVRAGTAAKSL